ncbi:tRNA (adenosine(37)-N6)-dimethylallyltransferase MiaA [Adhaeribacter rhizoryzae]|uniref:tRNA dimethylallyltransferase n=1 Tax=Adhaeribacter rhizoryzae TaxID=2607907 RepID=A0A5M6D787_9BACT|nr:tRNA (adenosine(37)-N6)-dimethylallyltransferase MiaA [Adhaeribacter rhizoryzae]KAA5542526.1 tRNA (adenosine(37)-N6)-dimethylallyltransferase MiaA [Adhaeribacter rhizoryzae]
MHHKNYAGPVLVVIAGPTAVGKTELCLKLARQLNTNIISADSRQFYREMNIGTAKPNAAELSAVKHYFINSHSITEEYSCGAFEADTLALLDKLFREKQTIILTGGSGLYIQAVCEGLDEMPDIMPAVRENLMLQLEQQGLENLLTQLQSLDPAYYEQVDRANPQRVIRALEVCYSSGQPYSVYRAGSRKQRPFKIVKIGLTRDRAELYQRIDQRMEEMLAMGLMEEAKSLYPYRAHNALQTVGYKEIFDFMEEKQDWPETVRLLKRNSRRYAKRQLTWFRRDPEFKWFHPEDWEGILTCIAQNSG